MSGYYASVYAYRAKLDPTRIFVTSEEARAFDRGYAAQVVANLGYDDIAKALEGGDNLDGVRAVIEFLDDELRGIALVKAA